MRVLIASLALVCSACLSTAGPVRTLASAEIVTDFETYQIRRVGLLLGAESVMTPEHAEQLKAAFFAEFSASTPYEIVPLTIGDLEEIPRSEPYRRGWYKAQTVIDITRRYNLDAVLVGTITDQQFFPPQRLGVQFDLVAAETGLVIWSSSLQLDAGQKAVRETMRHWANKELGGVASDDWRLTLISPRRFARFAAFQVAQVL
jgi:hypothetical protein